MSNLPKAGSFLVAHGENDFIAESIQEAVKIQQKRVGTYTGQKLWNHVACIIEVDKVLFVGESLQDGFTISPWIGSRYERNLVEYELLEWKFRDWSEKELIEFTILIKSIKGTPYDFEGIVDSLDKVTTGIWNGKKGLEAEKRMYCSEAIATQINKVRKGVFIYPWAVNPQEFYQNPNITVCKEQLYKK